MTSIARRIRRQTKDGRAAYKARRKTEIDALNDRVYQEARDAGCSHFRQLHPTKGWCRFSFKKVELCGGGKLDMAMTITETLQRANKHAVAIGYAA